MDLSPKSCAKVDSLKTFGVGQMFLSDRTPVQLDLTPNTVGHDCDYVGETRRVVSVTPSGQGRGGPIVWTDLLSFFPPRPV